MKAFQSLICLLLLAPAVGVAAIPQLGVNPVPVVNNLTVQTAISYDAGSRFYTYTYAVTNPPSNTGSIWLILLDMTAPIGYFDFGAGSVLTMPEGAAGNVTFDSERQSLQRPSVPINFKMIPFGISAPPGWDGMVDLDGTGGFGGGNNAMIDPGQTVSGLSMISRGVPTVKTMQLSPLWMLDMGTEEATEEEQIQAAQIAAALVVHVSVLAPSWVSPGGFDHWDELQKDVAGAIQLGWIADATLAQTITSQLQTARTSMNKEGPDFNTVAALKTLLNTVTSATPGQLPADGYNLLTNNLNAMLRVYGNPQPPQPQSSPKVTILDPSGPAYLTSATVGTSVTITAQVVDQAQNDAPIANYIAPLSVISGPNAGVFTRVPTDANGRVSLTYKGAAVGQDTVSATLQSAAPRAAIRPLIVVRPPTDTATVIWKGGPDLIISEFTPPVMETDGQRPIHITDTTKNIGNTPIGPSSTLYYLSTTTPVDPKTAILVGQRPVPALIPGQEDFYQTDVPFPSGAGGPGTYYLTACANGDRAVIETNYANNCEVRQIALPLKHVNLPPDCSKAHVTRLRWLPHHQIDPASIQGVTDLDGDAVTIRIVNVTRVKPDEECRDDKARPDESRDGKDREKRHDERCDDEAGRFYLIHFTADDRHGATCTGTVQARVREDGEEESRPREEEHKDE